MTKSEVIRLQRQLRDAGLYTGSRIDGIFGPMTAAAYQKLIEQRELDQDTPLYVPPPVKPWWTSSGIWASLATVVIGAFGLAEWGIDSESLTQLLVALSTVVAGVLAARGRATASQAIDSSRLAPGLRRNLGGGMLRVPDQRPPAGSGRGYWANENRGPLG